jgi:hypothetical protein
VSSIDCTGLTWVLIWTWPQPYPGSNSWLSGDPDVIGELSSYSSCNPTSTQTPFLLSQPCPSLPGLSFLFRWNLSSYPTSNPGLNLAFFPLSWHYQGNPSPNPTRFYPYLVKPIVFPYHNWTKLWHCFLPDFKCFRPGSRLCLILANPKNHLSSWNLLH